MIKGSPGGAARCYAVIYSRTMMEAGDGGSRARHVSGQDFLALTQGKPSCQPRRREIEPAGRPGRPIRKPVRQAIGIGLDDLPFLDSWAFPFIILGGMIILEKRKIITRCPTLARQAKLLHSPGTSSASVWLQRWRAAF
ncbi:hypothetical protein V2G26_016537 [Clonostachys chloroleuca]